MTRDKRNRFFNRHAPTHQYGTIKWTKYEDKETGYHLIYYLPTFTLLPERVTSWLGKKWVRKQFYICWATNNSQWRLVTHCHGNGNPKHWRDIHPDYFTFIYPSDDEVVALGRRDELEDMMRDMAENHPFLGMTKLNWIYRKMRRTLHFTWRIIVISATLSAIVTLYLVWEGRQ